MESGYRISHYLRGYDPGFIARFPIRPCFTRGKFVQKSYRSSGFRGWEGPRLFFCCSSLSPGKMPLPSDCFSQQEDHQEFHLAEPCQVTGGVVALGKFDALHIGHRELAIQASRAGSPYLLSFVGMAEVLGWEQRSPVVAKCDRERVLALWAPYCGNIIPVEYQIEFSSVRHLSPRQFVERLSNELGVSGVVAGENYRFGYKASGDASELVRLCEEYGLGAYIVRSVMDRRQMSSNTGSKTDGLRERGQVSSTRVRHALAVGDMEYVSQLLGRPHRLVLAVGPEYLITGNRISAPKSCLLNQPPGDGHYGCCTALAGNVGVEQCIVTIDTTHVHTEFRDDVDFHVLELFQNCHIMGIDFGHSR
ncbi:FAD synthetase 1, chloroplastic-like isoform X2 [Aristolochia californica]|uniref:FAD synthetase 1, chloroplastic-like isoform X2 n=1 Tax=Aristolochia californica TaxID=171875 RepID=UPI0035DC045A